MVWTHRQWTIDGKEINSKPNKTVELRVAIVCTRVTEIAFLEDPSAAWSTCFSPHPSLYSVVYLFFFFGICSCVSRMPLFPCFGKQYTCRCVGIFLQNIYLWTHTLVRFVHVVFSHWTKTLNSTSKWFLSERNQNIYVLFGVIKFIENGCLWRPMVNAGCHQTSEWDLLNDGANCIQQTWFFEIDQQQHKHFV